MNMALINAMFLVEMAGIEPATGVVLGEETY